MSRKCARLPPGDLRYVNRESLAKVAGGCVERQFGNCRPEVELIAFGTAFEALECVFSHVDCQRSAARRCRAMDGTWSTQFIAARLHDLEIKQTNNVGQADQGAKSSIVDSWHRLAVWQGWIADSQGVRDLEFGRLVLRLTPAFDVLGDLLDRCTGLPSVAVGGIVA